MLVIISPEGQIQITVYEKSILVEEKSILHFQLVQQSHGKLNMKSFSVGSQGKDLLHYYYRRLQYVGYIFSKPSPLWLHSNSDLSLLCILPWPWETCTWFLIIHLFNFHLISRPPSAKKPKIVGPSSKYTDKNPVMILNELRPGLKYEVSECGDSPTTKVRHFLKYL